MKELDIASLTSDSNANLTYHRRSGYCDRVIDRDVIAERRKTFTLMSKFQRKLTAAQKLEWIEARYARWVAGGHASCTGRRKDKSRCPCECHKPPAQDANR